ncbi:hypothetical protein FB451DRAFT_1285265 [Mycena latifolia]|nr:hypothetical protein FB451DRAFT_1285265 [Mycena latifolia]
MYPKVRLLALSSPVECHSFPRSRDSHHDTIILQADLMTGDSQILLHLPIAAFFVPRVKFVGNYFACWIQEEPASFLFVNWRTAEFIIFGSEELELTNPTLLFPGHIAFYYRSYSTTPHVRLYHIPSLSHLWRPLEEFTVQNPMDPTDLLHFVIDVPNFIATPREYPHRNIYRREPSARRELRVGHRGRASPIPWPVIPSQTYTKATHQYAGTSAALDHSCVTV